MFFIARPRKPASLKAGKSETKEHLDERALVEEELKGDDDLVYSSIPSSLDALGQRYYMFIVDELKSSKVLANLDIPIITHTADALSRMEQLDLILNESGLMEYTKDKFGNDIVKEHPAVNTKMKYLSQFRGLSTQLGLSPSARSQLAEMKMQDKQEAEDPLLAALGG